MSTCLRKMSDVNKNRRDCTIGDELSIPIVFIKQFKTILYYNVWFSEFRLAVQKDLWLKH